MGDCICTDIIVKHARLMGAKLVVSSDNLDRCVICHYHLHNAIKFG